MPDGDHVPSDLPQCFQEPFMMVCEGQTSDDYLQDAVLVALVDRLKQIGDGPLFKLKEIVQLLIPFAMTPLFMIDKDHTRVRAQIDDTVRSIPNKRYAAMVKDVALRTYEQIVWETIPLDRTVEFVALHEYISEVYHQEFHNRVPRAIREKPDTNVEQLAYAMTELKRGIEQQIPQLVKQLTGDRSTQRLRPPTWDNPSGEPDITDDLLLV